jgi:hypothetical protein
MKKQAIKAAIIMAAWLIPAGLGAATGDGAFAVGWFGALFVSLYIIVD